MNELMRQAGAIFAAIIGVAILAVIVSRQANTSQVLETGFKGFSTILGTALSPVTGGPAFGGGASFP